MKDIPGYIKFSILALGIALVIAAMILAKELFVPIVWALLLTLMVMPVAAWLEKRIKSRAISALIAIGLMIIALGSVVLLVSSQVVSLAKDVPTLESKLQAGIDGLRNFADKRLGFAFEEQKAALQDQLPSTTGRLLEKLGSTLQHTVTTLALLIVVPIYMFFFLCYRDRFMQFVIKISQVPKTARTLDTMTKASKIVQQYLRGIGIEVVLMGVMSGIVFVSLGIRHALFFAVLVAILNIIPYIGVFIANLIAVTYAYLTTDSALYPVLVFVLLWVVQIIDNNFIAPYIVGHQIRLNPLAVILAVVLGGLIWGVSGMVVFIPLLGMAKVILDESEDLKPYGYLLGDQKGDKPKTKSPLEEPGPENSQ
jgi:predicted PurR-regulated permease PerM